MIVGVNEVTALLADLLARGMVAQHAAIVLFTGAGCNVCAPDQYAPTPTPAEIVRGFEGGVRLQPTGAKAGEASVYAMLGGEVRYTGEDGRQIAGMTTPPHPNWATRLMPNWKPPDGGPLVPTTAFDRHMYPQWDASSHAALILCMTARQYL